MQAGLVTRRLALSDIFTGRLVTLRVFVAIVDTAAGGSPPLSCSYEQRAGGLINSERRKHRRYRRP